MTEAHQVRFVMGTIAAIRASASDLSTRPISDAIACAFEEIERIERLLSIYDPQSKLSRVNQLAGTFPCKVSRELFDLFTLAVSYNLSSGGVFDVTAGRLSELWQQSAACGMVPSKQEIDSARESTGPAMLSLDAGRLTVSFSHPDVAIDLGGFAKGYAVDRAVEILRARGISRALVSLGSSSIASFSPNQDDGHEIAMRDPLDADRLIAAFKLMNRSLSTSGGAERGVMENGRLVQAVIDPRTASPCQNALSATVITDSATRAEVMSKMLLILGCREAFERFDRLGWAAEGILLEPAPGGRMGIWRSSGFPGFRSLPPEESSVEDLPQTPSEDHEQTLTLSR